MIFGAVQSCSLKYWKVKSPLRVVPNQVLKSSALVAFALLVGCSNSGTIASQSMPTSGVDYVTRWEDDPAQRVFHVQLEALSDKAICTGPGRWPSGSGHVGGAGLKVTAIVDGQTFTYPDTDMEACIYRKCENPIRRGMKLESILTYEGFGIPDALRNAAKDLRFDPSPYWCDWRKSSR